MNNNQQNSLEKEEMEATLLKKLKTNRGRPKISTKSIISRPEREYLQKQTELVRMKYNFINRKLPALNPTHTITLIKEHFGKEKRDLYEKIFLHNHIFLNQMKDPSAQGFEDECDFGYLMIHFNNHSEFFSIDCVMMVFLAFLADDMDEEGLLLIIEALKQFKIRVQKIKIYQPSIPIYKPGSQDYFELLCSLINLLNLSLDEYIQNTQGFI